MTNQNPNPSNHFLNPNPPNYYPDNPNPNQRVFLNRIGILVQNPPNYDFLLSISCRPMAVGVFNDMASPAVILVRQIVEIQWETRGPIHITRTRCYCIFEYTHHRDREALLLQITVIMDGKIINFRPTSEYQVPSNIHFNMALLCVRVHDLP